MTLRMLQQTLQQGFPGSIANVLLEVVHACVEQFDATHKRQDTEISALKEMIARLEDRQNQHLAAVRHALCVQLENLQQRITPPNTSPPPGP